MGIITTQILGFGQPKPGAQQKADPKPVTGLDWTGNPMKEGDYYGGRPEHMGPEQLKEIPLTERRLNPEWKPTPKAKQKGVGSGGYKRSEESRMRQRAKAIAWWARRRAQAEMKKANPENSG